jgi:hypothetical protein
MHQDLASIFCQAVLSVLTDTGIFFRSVATASLVDGLRNLFSLGTAPVTHGNEVVSGSAKQAILQVCRRKIRDSCPSVAPLTRVFDWNHPCLGLLVIVSERLVATLLDVKD